MTRRTWQPLASIEALKKRSRLLAQARAFFADRDVIEVQTPLLARATVTDPDVESIPVPGYGFLQTSPEYFMKRLLAAGMPSCYQLASAFRHDERGSRHNPEFTMLEWYRLDYDDGALRQEVAELCDVLLGPAEYQVRTYADLVGDLERPREDLDLAFAEACDALGPGRFFVTDYPADQAALARVRARAEGSQPVAARFELVIDGVEVANGYWELLDAGEHETRFAEDNRRRARRGLPEREVDAAFLDALADGLPACAGVAVGFDRLVMLALGARTLDEVLAFRD